MGIINRRNAVLGWGVWQVAKMVGKRKLRSALPGAGDHAGLNKSALALIAAAIGGALWLLRRSSEDAPGTMP
jgi:hypothetical protein